MTALEIFEELVKSYTTIFNMALNRPRDTIVNWEGVDFVKKELIALEIIKKKCSPLLKQYLLDLLPKEESDLLKEVLL